ncbi:chemotaxis protein [Falsiroseomonas ponticola]|jgi:chemotaxis protein CheD|uniref:chemotaxis protein n=1 Tax=Falsiroseomonas ponticola TaxID=2786951 RepID=UPI001931E0A6|nr:chemotaxis protein [Roseomonas ponticola]
MSAALALPGLSHDGAALQSRLLLAGDPLPGRRATKVGPGEFHVAAEEEAVIVTVLGSCIAACIRDPVARVGGLNHFMLPVGVEGGWGKAAASLRYGNFAMERLVNELMARGARRDRMEVKLFGGARLGASTDSVGQRNIDFIEAYLRAEGMVAAVRHLGGTRARSVVYQPVEGRAYMRLLPEATETVSAVEGRLRRHLATRPVAGSIEIFE